MRERKREREGTSDWRVVAALFPVAGFVAPFSFLLTAAPPLIGTAEPRFAAARSAAAAEPWTALRPCVHGGSAQGFRGRPMVSALCSGAARVRALARRRKGEGA